MSEAAHRDRLPRVWFWWSDVTGNPWPDCACNDWRYDEGHMQSCPAHGRTPDRAKPPGFLAGLLWRFRASRIGSYLAFSVGAELGRCWVNLSLFPDAGLRWGKEPTEEQVLDAIALEQEWELV